MTDIAVEIRYISKVNSFPRSAGENVRKDKRLQDLFKVEESERGLNKFYENVPGYEGQIKPAEKSNVRSAPAVPLTKATCYI